MGIISLNDLFDLSNFWSKSSANGYNSRVSGAYLSTYQRQNFILLVDNQKIQLNFLDEQNIDLLPFTPDQIDTIKFVNSPLTYKGYFAGEGLIDIKLKEPSGGFSLETMQSIGNKSGDPGPYAYTEYRTPNVDKLGYIAGINLKSAGNNWALNTNLKYSENFVTDPALERRITPLSTNSKARLLGTSIDLSYKLLGGLHSVLFAFSENEDFFYFPRFGNEVPSTRIFRHIGLSGSIPLSSQITFKYRIIKGINELARTENSRNFNFNLKVNSTTIDLGSEYKSKKFSGFAGIVYEKHDANRSGYGNDEQINFLKVLLQADYAPSESIINSAGIELLKNQNLTRKKIHMSSLFGFNKFHSLKISAALTETGINEELNYYTWTNSGVQILEPEDFQNDFIQSETSKKMLAVEGAYHYNVNDIFDLIVGGFYRNFEDYYLENYIYNLSSDGSRLVPFYELSQGEFLKIAGGTTEIKYKFSEHLTNRISYVYQQPLEGSDNFTEYWKRFPKHNAGLFVNYTPVNSFNIWIKLNYISQTVWKEFTYITEQSNKLYNYEISRKMLTDISFRKSVWNSRLWISLLFRNIFNQTDYSNPIGVNMGLRFYLIIQLQLKSIFE